MTMRILLPLFLVAGLAVASARSYTVKLTKPHMIGATELKAGDLLGRLISLRTDDPDLNVVVRGDAKTKYKQIRAVLDICQQANIVKVDLATELNP